MNYKENTYQERLNKAKELVAQSKKCKKKMSMFKYINIACIISIICLMIVFGPLKGLCIFGFVTGCILLHEDESSNKSKKKENKDQFLTEDEFEDAFK